VTDCDTSGSVTASSSSSYYYTDLTYNGGVIGYLGNGTPTNNFYTASTGQAFGIGYDYRVGGVPSNTGATPR
jgi:hypothetical protein